MLQKTILIIGAGIAGQSAGCYAQMNGYRLPIFELHDLPGDLCTSWQLKTYIFDGLHPLPVRFGAVPALPLHVTGTGGGAGPHRHAADLPR
jgi:flavin-dependent dehydrogenase